MTNSSYQPLLKVAVVTGQHPFDVPTFHTALRALPGIDAYPQDLDDFVADAGTVRHMYDAIVFYNFHQTTPGDEPGQGLGARAVLESLGEGQQGIVVLHHALLAWPGWPFWSELCGIADGRFGYHPGQTLRLEVAAEEHPITSGLPAWEMHDESYTMQDAGDDSTVLLSTQHPKSMTTIAWARQHRNARVFCLQSGHDGEAFGNPSFRTVLGRGIRWTAGQL